MAQYYTNTKLLLAPVNEKEDLIKIFKTLGEIDCDFCGQNGPFWLWPEAKTHSFQTNADFLAHTVLQKDCKTVQEYADAFTKEWMERDPYYESIYILTEKAEDNTDFCGTYAFSIITVNYN